MEPTKSLDKLSAVIHPVQIAGGFIGMLMLAPAFGQSVQSAFVTSLNAGTLYDRVLLLIWVLVLGSVGVNGAVAVLRRIHWRLWPRSKCGQWIERKLLSRLFFSERRQVVDLRRLREEAWLIWHRKTGIPRADLSTSEIVAVMGVMEDSGSKARELRRAEIEFAWSAMMAGFSLVAWCGYGVQAAIGRVSGFAFFVASLLMSGALLLQLLFAKASREEASYAEAQQLAKFVFDESKNSVEDLPASSSGQADEGVANREVVRK
jgi:hypothetical protein